MSASTTYSPPGGLVTVEGLPYDPKPSLRYAAKVGSQAAVVGLFVSTIQNALGTHSRGTAGFLTRYGGTIGVFAGMGAAFALTESVVANQRQRDDPINGVAGGCAAGFLAGLRSRSLPMAVASCAVLGAAVGVFDYSGQTIAGHGANESVEEKRKRFFKQRHGPPSPTQQAEE
ncbi:hypothetical protein GLOTRDRAFT_68344 [Gloeophyllum trabeum ATCC 11539]|uniref:Uncharacterized protein n=1 Tax=Gloeophyllum trabeum (strain ATCC 11539 / FP-39264 / Madison 617) TaxID=670483 RepID=S7RZV2_GLOTA|nr:uncharacterized protein GLOTRDRAFT_68344 [Gloeophyllum trabeum ATCC 11539]EPQ60580.1 hypothetical protein GLOTRDRAFT_68344 [Gloeophyllum trabeum ATCC 11539]